MKKLMIVLLLFSFGQMLSAQINFKVDDGVFTMQGVIETPLSKEDIYNQVLDWYSEEFTSAKAVIDYENYETGKVTGSYYNDYSIGLGVAVSFRHKISVEFKENKARLTIDHIKGDNGVLMEEYLINRKGEYRSMYSGLRNRVMDHGKDIYSSLETKLHEKPQSSDW